MTTTETILQLVTGGLIGLLGQLLYFALGSKKSKTPHSKGKGKWDYSDPTVVISCLVLSFATGLFTCVSILHLSLV